ncbi:MAG TPA: DJ-1/PfpI family protein [Devosia sp.]
MTTIVTVLTEGFADWETTLLNAVAHGYYGLDVAYATPDGKPVKSAGGMRVAADLAVEDIELDKVDAVVFCGGTAWQSPGAPDIAKLAKAAVKKGKVVAGICDGTMALAKAGLLDDVAHTSNGAGYLDGTGYKGQSRYRDVPYAVADGCIVTAPGTAPVRFMEAVMQALGKADGNLDYYVGLHAAQYKAAA